MLLKHTEPLIFLNVIFPSKNLVNSKYSIYSNNDHIVPFEILDKFPKTINSKPLLIENIGHMGSKSGLEELPQVVEIINNKI